MDNIELKPIGIVHATEGLTAEIPLHGRTSIIEIFPQYTEALDKIEENSHLWILSWFHEARRDLLTKSPARVNPDAPSYGVFALRTPMRPNPIALTLVDLNHVSENCLHVGRLDALDGTLVLDIKPYYEQDTVFSPRTAKILASTREMRKEFMEKEAIRHHRENCRDLQIGIRMALIAEERLGKLNNDDILVEVIGTNCLGDVLQGVTRARLANPSRFSFSYSSERIKSIWTIRDIRFSIEMRTNFLDSDLEIMTDEQLFLITPA